MENQTLQKSHHHLRADKTVINRGKLSFKQNSCFFDNIPDICICLLEDEEIFAAMYLRPIFKEKKLPTFVFSDAATTAAQRIAEGWQYGKMQNDACKLHPCLVPY